MLPGPLSFFHAMNLFAFIISASFLLKSEYRGKKSKTDFNLQKQLQ